MLEWIVIILVLYLTVQYYRRSIMLEDYNGRHVMITGCDTGFGNMLAKRLDSMGFTVFAGCLTEKGGKDLKTATSDRLHVVSLDVTKIESIQNAMQVVKASLPHDSGLWGLVINAGIAGAFGELEWLKLEDYKSVMDINFFGIVETCRLFLPLVRREKGRIVCITSILGRVAAGSGSYVSSKFAAEGYCDVLRRSMRSCGVTVHILEPGYFDTDILNRERAHGSIAETFANADEDVKKFYGEEYRDKFMKLTRKALDGSSKDTYKVVDAYVHALCAKYPKNRYVVGTDANTVFRFLWTVPEWLSDFILSIQLPVPRDTMLEWIVIVLVLYLTVQYYRRSVMLEDYKGRHVMITGCDTGFGNMLAKRLDSMGFTVFAGCLTEKGGKDLKTDTSDRLHVVSLDVTKIESIQNAMEVIKSSLPQNTGLWGLVNNAGIAGAIGELEWLKLENYKLVMDINFFGIVETCRIFLPLVRREKGRIVCITSILGRIAAGGASYASSKFAAEGYCDVLRRSVRSYGVTVHILEPGYFDTNILNRERVCGSIAETFTNADEDVKKFYGEEYRDELIVFTRKALDGSSKDTYKVVDAYVHALCAKYPKYRYVVGTDANTIFRFLWTVPEWLSDFLLCSKLPVPRGIKG
ncbi:hypothetical protein FSP39_010460 [Pinctada imbricata]|uniref:Uncharacterized protein n=1 Tax=Pinctada imbricata TaxID=66713 RepID=A0AA89BTE3_PINIB|nr:hypothetical protein FSP39_010460 [Pinctada imbricata]